jgi:hypothetical protein
MTNTTFWRAVHSLGHPVTFGAVILLLLNDHWLRLGWPSWWTGKLGDAAWLLFAPFFAAMAFALILPWRLRQHETIVGGLSILFIGVWFTLAKTTPSVYAVTIHLLDGLAGWHGTLGMDATDLITLPVLFISWHIWQTSPNTASRLSPRVWVIGGLGMMGTLATSCLPADYGITQLCRDGNALYAFSQQAAFTSVNGGITWTPAFYRGSLTTCFHVAASNPIGSKQAWLLTDAGQTYRLVPGVAIYGYYNSIEKLEIDLTEMGRDLRKTYYEGFETRLVCAGPRAFAPGPLDALIDRSTGNLVVAMGHDGILTRVSGGVWHWMSVGNYHKGDVYQVGVFLFIQHDLLAMGLLLVLLPATITLLNRRLPIIVLGGWVLWLLSFTLKGFISFVDVLFPFSTLLWALIVAGVLLNWKFARKLRFEYEGTLPIITVVILSLVTALLFLLPYILWARGSLPNYGTASAFAALLTIASFIASVQYMRRRFPLKRKKPKRDLADLVAAESDDETVSF